MSWRSTSRHSTSVSATALVWCGVCSSMEAKPKNSPPPARSTTTSCPSSSTVVTRTAPDTIDIRLRRRHRPFCRCAAAARKLCSTWLASTAVSSSSSNAKRGTCRRTSGLHAIGPRFYHAVLPGILAVKDLGNVRQQDAKYSAMLRSRTSFRSSRRAPRRSGGCVPRFATGRRSPASPAGSLRRPRRSSGAVPAGHRTRPHQRHLAR